MEPVVDKVSNASEPEACPITAEKQQRKRLSGAARKRFRRLRAEGSDIETALKLCSKPWRDLFAEKLPPEKRSLKRARSEEDQGPPKKAPKLSTSGDHTRPRKKGFSRVGIQNSEPMNEDQMKLIHYHLNVAIAKQSADGDGPQFLGFTHKTGWILVICVDQRSQDWLVSEIAKFKPWPYAQLTVIPETELPKPIRVLTFVPESEAPSIEEALALLKAQNKGLNTELWRVLNEKVVPRGRVITFSMDGSSIEALRATNFEAVLGFKRVFFKIKGLPASTQSAPSTSTQYTSGTQSLDFQNHDGKARGLRRETDRMVGLAGPSSPVASNRLTLTVPRHETQRDSFKSCGGTYRDQRRATETGRMVGWDGPANSAAGAQASATSKRSVPRTETQGFLSRGGTYAAQSEADRIFGQDGPFNPRMNTQPSPITPREYPLHDTQLKGFQSHGGRYTDQRDGWNRPSPSEASTQSSPRQHSMSGSRHEDFYSFGSTYTDHRRETDRMVGRNGSSNSAARTQQQQYSMSGTHPEDFQSYDGFTRQRRERGRNNDRDTKQLEYSMPGIQREDFLSHGGSYSYTDQRREAEIIVGQNRPLNPSTQQKQHPMSNIQLEDFRRHDDRFTNQRESVRMIGQDGLTPATSTQEQYPMYGTQLDFHRRASSYTDLRRERGRLDWDTQQQQYEYPMPGTQTQVFQRHGDTYTSQRESGRIDDRIRSSRAERGWQTESRDRSERPIQASTGDSWPVQARVEDDLTPAAAITKRDCPGDEDFHITGTGEEVQAPTMAEHSRRLRKTDPEYPMLLARLTAARTPRAPRVECAVFGCRGSERDAHLTFRPLPGEPERWSHWLQLINRQDLSAKLRAGGCGARVCSRHFAPDAPASAAPALLLPARSRQLVYADSPELSIVKNELDEINFEPEAPPTYTYHDDSSPPEQPGPDDDQLGPDVGQLRPNVDQLIPNVDQLRPNVDQLRLNVDQLSPNVNLPASDVDQLRPNVAQPRLNVHLPGPTVCQQELNTDTETADSPPLEIDPYFEFQVHASTQTDSAEAFHRLGTFAAVERTDIPPRARRVAAVERTDIPPRARRVAARRSVAAQTGPELAEHFTVGLKMKMEAELQEVNEKLKRAGNTQIQKTQFLRQCNKYLDEKIANFIQSHAYLSDKFEGNKYPAAFKAFALNLYLRNPTAYEFVERFFNLPSRETIQKFIMPTQTGINESLMEFFKVKVDQMSVKGRMCVVCFDVIELSRNLYYDVTNDYLCGVQEIDQVFGTEPAEYAAVIMVRGLYMRWKQSVSFAFLSEKRKNPDLEIWLHKTIKALFDLGLTVKALVRNVDDEFLDISLDETAPYFEVDGKKIYHIYDVPDILKHTRNQLMQYDFHIGDYIAKWEHVLSVYDLDKQQELKLMSNITDDHMRPDPETRNDVKLATQVFSGSVAAAMHFHVIARFHSKQTKDTVQFIKKMSNLYDVLYSRTMSKAYRGSAAQQRFLKETIEYLGEIEVRDKHGNAVENKFAPGLIITIKSIMRLMADQKKSNVNYLLTKNLSKDCMQTFFDQARRLAKCERPTPIKFTRAFRRLFLVNLLNNTKVGATADDMNITLAKITEYVKVDINNKYEAKEMNSFAVGVTDYKIRWPSNEYIAGYLLWKCLERHACPHLIKNLSNNYNIEVQEEPDLLIQMFQSYNSENIHNVHLKKPPPQLTGFVGVMERKFDDYCKRMDRRNVNFGRNLYVHMDCFLLMCPCFPLEFMKRLYIRLKIFDSVKKYNRINKGQAVQE